MIISTAEAKSFLKITTNDEDTLIGQIVDAVDTRIKSFLNNDLDEAAYTEELVSGHGNSFLIPKHFPITAVSKIEVYEGLDSTNTEEWDEWVQGDDYDRLIIAPNGETVIFGGAHFPKGTLNVRLTYTAGYSTIPKDIMFAAFQLVQLYYMGVRGEAKLGKSSISRPMGQGVSTTFDLQAETNILDTIIHYKLYNV